MNSNMKRIIVNFVLVILAFIVQTLIFSAAAVPGGIPNLMVILVFSFGFIRGKRMGDGLRSDRRTFDGSVIRRSFGVPYACLYLDGLCKRNLYKYYYEDYITLPLVLSALNEVFYNFYLYVFGFLVRGRLNFGYYFINIILPETIFTVVTTLILYRLFLYISRKLEEMEKRRDTTIV